MDELVELAASKKRDAPATKLALLVLKALKQFKKE
jgi:hypothetical protein